MKAFTRLYHRLDATTSTNAKLGAMADYIGEAPPAAAGAVGAAAADSGTMTAVLQLGQMTWQPAYFDSAVTVAPQLVQEKSTVFMKRGNVWRKYSSIRCAQRALSSVSLDAVRTRPVTGNIGGIRSVGSES